MSQGRMLGNIQARRAVGDAPWTTNRGSTDYLRTLARMAPSRSKNFYAGKIGWHVRCSSAVK